MEEGLIRNISQTSGIAGVREFINCQKNNCLNLFIDWYKKDTSFCTQRGKEIAEKVIKQIEQLISL